MEKQTEVGYTSTDYFQSDTLILLVTVHVWMGVKNGCLLITWHNNAKMKTLTQLIKIQCMNRFCNINFAIIILGGFKTLKQQSYYYKYIFDRSYLDWSCLFWSIMLKWVSRKMTLKTPCEKYMSSVKTLSDVMLTILKVKLFDQLKLLFSIK